MLPAIEPTTPGARKASRAKPAHGAPLRSRPLRAGAAGVSIPTRRQSALTALETLMPRRSRPHSGRLSPVSPPDDRRLTRVHAPFTQDVRAWRESPDAPDAVGEFVANIPWSCIIHSPCGWECGYGGSGPADFALNILNAFLPPRLGPVRGWYPVELDKDPQRVYRGIASHFAVQHHQEFERDFIETMDRNGGTLPADVIRAWIQKRAYKDILSSLFGAADNHGADTGEADHTVGDLQDLLRAAWSLMSRSQRRDMLSCDATLAVIEAGSRGEFGPEDLIRELT